MAKDIIFTDEDHFLILYIIEYVFPKLSGKDATNNVKWLKNLMKFYYGWHGFFNNKKVKTSDSNFHLYLLKLVSNKRKMLECIRSGDIDKGRQRMTESLRFMMWRRGGCKIHFYCDETLIKDFLRGNISRLSELLHSEDPELISHFFFVLGSFYHAYKNSGYAKVHIMTFYVFVDTAIKIINQQTHNESKHFNTHDKCKGKGSWNKTNSNVIPGSPRIYSG